jgi:phosphatidylserine decarboxylase
MIRIHREGYAVVAVTVVILVGMLVLVALYLPSRVNYPAALATLVILILVLRFFRVPRRRPFLEEKTVVAPADGKVVVIERTGQDEFISGPCIQVSIFMSIHDVHINYYPVNGKVSYLKYHPGRYLVARQPKSSQLNERFSTGIETPFGPLLIRQVAGTIARRIRNYAELNGPSNQGKEIGFIRFGSRLDLFLPEDAKILVELNQRVTGSVTPIARFK